MTLSEATTTENRGKRSAWLRLLAASAVAVVCLQVPAVADEPWGPAGYEPTQAFPEAANGAADGNNRSDREDEFPGYKDSRYRRNPFLWNWG